MLAHIIHDWSEEQCLTILRNCHRAMHSDARVLIIEMVLPAGDVPHPGKMLDMMMLVGPGGQERTEQEYATLLEKGRLRLRAWCLRRHPSARRSDAHMKLSAS